MSWSRYFREADCASEASDLAALGFVDSTYGNDAGPSFTRDNIVVWIASEVDEHRYAVVVWYDIERETDNDSWSTDSWSDALSTIRNIIDQQSAF